jgi:hypothetical protein
MKYVALSAIGITSGVSHMTDKWELTPRATVMFYVGACNGIIAILFLLRKGMWVLGKNPKTGKLPLWSYILWAGFHVPNTLYTFGHHHILGKVLMMGAQKEKSKDGTMVRKTVPSASEIYPGWWIGGKYADDLGIKHWGGIVDLTVEFEESCFDQCAVGGYLNVLCWDGVPPTPAQLDVAATHCANIKDPAKNPIIIHCAHGRGRSTTCMCAAFVKAGLHPTWESAFEAIKLKRPCVKLNSKMRKALTEWQEEFVTGKKAH